MRVDFNGTARLPTEEHQQYQFPYAVTITFETWLLYVWLRLPAVISGGKQNYIKIVGLPAMKD